MENRSFYNEILTEHNIHPEFKHDLPDADIELAGVNPSCGDEIRLKLKTDGGIITDGVVFASLVCKRRDRWRSYCGICLSWGLCLSRRYG